MQRRVQINQLYVIHKLGLVDSIHRMRKDIN